MASRPKKEAPPKPAKAKPPKAPKAEVVNKVKDSEFTQDELDAAAKALGAKSAEDCDIAVVRKGDKVHMTASRKS